MPDAGYFQKAPKQAAPCPQGQYRAINDNINSCKPCGTGITTKSTMSTAQYDCTSEQRTFVLFCMQSGMCMHSLIHTHSAQSVWQEARAIACMRLCSTTTTTAATRLLYSTLYSRLTHVHLLPLTLCRSGAGWLLCIISCREP